MRSSSADGRPEAKLKKELPKFIGSSLILSVGLSKNLLNQE